MPLFDDRERTETRPARFAEPTYEYLSLSARPYARRVRAVLEDWFSAYPEERRDELEARFRAGFEAPFFELFVHALLGALECHVEVDPEIPDGTPDFLAQPPAGESFYVEATLARDESDDERSLRRVEEQILDGINRLDSPNFMLDVTVHRVSTRTPSGTRIRAFLREKLGELDPDEVRRRYEEEDGWFSLPVFVYETEDVRIDFRPIPVRATQPGADRPAIGVMGPAGPTRLAPHEAIRDKVRKKGNAYDPPGPYVVAINAVADVPPRVRAVVDALFGDVVTRATLNPTGPPSNLEDVRLPNGVWRGPDGQYNRISAVLATLPAHHANLADVPLFVVQNPWANYPLEDALDALPTLVAEDGRLVRREGRSTEEIFGLPPDWPGVLDTLA